MPHKNREDRLKWYAERRAEIRRIVEAGKNKPCMDCETQYHPYVMQYDHVRGKKKFNLGAATQNAPNLQAVRDEIAKCEVVCANCHAMRTWSRLQEESSVSGDKLV